MGNFLDFFATSALSAFIFSYYFNSKIGTMPPFTRATATQLGRRRTAGVNQTVLPNAKVFGTANASP